jgi:glycosyltransferase involved in cell wall biosynthesis
MIKLQSDIFISIILPCHNEEQSLDAFFERIQPILHDIDNDWEIVCINDGSQDKTLEILKSYSNEDARIKVINFARNFGKEAAMTAGIDKCNGQVVIPIDADLQDPPELIANMVELWREGYDVVLATRNSRKGESWIKKTTAAAFYKIIGKMANIDIPANTGDYRLMDRKVVESIKALTERNRFMKGLFAWSGFKTTTIYFDRDERYAGNTSWNYWKLWQFALDGIFSFTTMPLKIWTYIGGLISLSSFIYAIILIAKTMVYGTDVPGYASLMVVMLFIGGIQLISLGVMGEYIARIYRETKARPTYIIDEDNRKR